MVYAPTTFAVSIPAPTWREDWYQKYQLPADVSVLLVHTSEGHPRLLMTCTRCIGANEHSYDLRGFMVCDSGDEACAVTAREFEGNRARTPYGWAQL